MSLHDPLGAVAHDLAALAKRDQRMILRAFDAEDRSRLLAAMRGGPSPIPGADHATGSSYSPWFEALIAAAMDADDDRLTSATRATLLQVIGRSRPAATRPTGRSLLQAAGGLLGQTRTQ